MKAITVFIFIFCAIWQGNNSFAEDFRYLKTLNGHEGKVTYVCFNGASNQVISGDEHGTILLWDIASGRILKRFEGHTGMVTDLQFDAAENRLASAAYDGTVRLWDVATTEELRRFVNPAIPPYNGVQGNEPTFVRFSPNEQFLWFGGYNMKIMRASLENGVVTELFSGDTYGITSAGFTPDGRYFLFGSGGTVTFINRETGLVEPQKTLGTHQSYEEFVCEFAFAPRSNILAVWTVSGHVRYWNITTGQMQRKIQAANRLGSSLIAFGGNGAYMLTGNLDSKTRLWRFPELTIAQELGEHTSAVKTFAFSPDSRYIATGSDDHTVKIWYKPDEMPIVPPPTDETVQVVDTNGQTTTEEEVNHITNHTHGILPVVDYVEGDSDTEEGETLEKVPVERPKEKFVLENVHFVQSTTVFLDSALAMRDLNYVVEVMQTYPTLIIELQGHTDNQGNGYANLILSEQRVEVVKQYLVEKGIAAERISTFGHGENRPRVPNNSEENMQKNRRVEVKVLQY